ncbi:MAG: undecaprenyl/decaprenyl-phosphate alpha-N-acetylglucosaminyl 1-phosphate transferase [Sphingobacteriaceae bacterium]|nr:undecaprenyl/decaprenyl-phosphate alpha-N-acetylglucosaminyl 1-phosphate transferase [Sphingobacteriaceae bacterium]
MIINYILLKFVQTLGIRGKEQQQVRWNPNSKPALGGISFYVIFLFAFIVTIFISEKSNTINLRLSGILIAGTLAFVMGLADDAFNTQPLLKFLTQVICGFVLIATGHSIGIFQNDFLNYILTVLWVVGFMNSINMLDNMDGISTIVSICICLFTILLNITLMQTKSYASILSIGLLGALCGFLIYNFHPSKMFMGDTGSQFLGLFLACMGIDNCWNTDLQSDFNFNHTILNFLIVALVFLIPLVDTITVIINRLKAGNSPFVGGKDHTTHHLFFKGITEKRIAILYFLISSIGVFIAYRLIISFSTTLMYIGFSFALLVFITLYLNTVIKREK